MAAKIRFSISSKEREKSKGLGNKTVLEPFGKWAMFLRKISLNLLLARFLWIAPPNLRDAIIPSFGKSLTSELKEIWNQNA